MRALLPKALDLLLGPAVGPIRTGNEVAGLEKLGSPPALLLSPPQKVAKVLVHKGYTHVRRFVAIPFSSVPRWVLPIGDANVTLIGTQIYMPHKWLPTAIKTLVEAMIKIGWSSSLGSQVLVASKEPLELETLVGQLTGEWNPVFALSLGRRLAVRKLTVQVMRPDGEILGYMKLPLTAAAVERVRHEASVLQRLWDFPALRSHIPRLLHSGSWNKTYLLFQSPVLGQLGPTNLTKAHEDFLQTLWRVNRTERSGQSLVEAIGEKWEKVVVSLGPKWKDLGQEVLRRSALELNGQTVSCAIGHGDFAPWNTRVYQERLLLFDWESAQWEVPLLWDIFHFKLQTAVSLRKRNGINLPAGRDARTAYRLYLLSSVIQFLQEGNLAAIDHRQKLLTSELEREISMRPDELVRKTHSVRSIDHRQSAKRATKSTVPAHSTPKIVTTSWDDGDPRDLKIAELLHSRGIAGTFYIPMSGYLNKMTLTGSDLRTLSSQGFEIGAHSMSHNSLTLLPGKQIEDEVRTCKQDLEEVLGTEVSMFCYPNGRYNTRVIAEVRRAGYKGARTTWMLSTRSSFLPFEMPTTLQAFPHRSAGYIRDLGRARDLSGLWKFSTELRGFPSWIDLGKRLFNQVLEYGGIWHLYGHSWEIDDLAIWNQLREILDYVSHREGVIYVTNGQLLPRLNT